MLGPRLAGALGTGKRHIHAARRTTARAQGLSIVSTLLTWNVPVHSDACCGFHGVLSEAATVVRRLQAGTCMPAFEPFFEAGRGRSPPLVGSASAVVGSGQAMASGVCQFGIGIVRVVSCHAPFSDQVGVFVMGGAEIGSPNSRTSGGHAAASSSARGDEVRGRTSAASVSQPVALRLGGEAQQMRSQRRGDEAEASGGTADVLQTTSVASCQAW